jgi:hypothetical protein
MEVDIVVREMGNTFNRLGDHNTLFDASPTFDGHTFNPTSAVFPI